MKLFQRSALSLVALSWFPSLLPAMTPPSLSVQVSPRSSVSGLGTPSGEGVGLNLFVRQSTRDELQSGRNTVGNPNDESTETWQTTLQADYRLTNRLTGFLSVPHLRSEARFNDPVTGSRVTQVTEGLGDVMLLGKYAVARDRVVDPTSELFALAGVEFPTGSRDERDDAGVRLPATQQLGSGQIDFILGVAGVWGLPVVTAYGDASYKINGKTNYRFGDLFAANVGVNTTIPSARAFSLSTEINAEIAAKDETREGGVGIPKGSKVPNTGYSRIYVTPGAQWRPVPSWTLNAGVQVPVYQNLGGTQLRSGLVYNAGVFTRFGDGSAE